MRKLTLSLAVLAALLPGRAITLGLGELELNSALNQELDAEIEVLSAAPEDAEQLLIKLADREAFARAGIDRPYLLQQLKFEIVTRGDKPYVRVFTKSPIREPFLSFLLEIDWPEGHLLREYTVLLDPPVYSSAPAATAPAERDAGGSRPFSDPAGAQAQAQPAMSQQDSARPAESAYMAPSPPSQGGDLPVRAPVTIQSADTGRQMTYQPMAQYREVSGNYRVQQNDTLWSVAGKLRPDSSISVEQMMLALVRENPEAFIKENIHGIKRGYILRMPSRNAITSVDRQAALAQVREHTALWREYRQAQSGGAPASAMESDMTATAEGISETPVDGKLSIVGASAEDGSDAAGAGQDPRARELKRLRNELSLAQESLESERMEKENLRARLAELEQRVQRVLEMDDAELAQLQQELQAGQQPEEPAVSEPMPGMAEDDMAQEAPADDMAAQPEEDMMQPPAAEEPAMDEAAPLDEPTAEGEQPVFVDEAPDAEETADLAPVEPVVPTVRPAEAPAFAQPRPTGFVENLLNDPKMLAAIGGGLMAVLALIALLMRRLRGGGSDDEWEADEELDSFSSDALDEPAPAPEAIEEPADSTAEMQVASFNDSQAEAADSAGKNFEDTMTSLANDEAADEEKDDVLAEADVYLAYGIYQQAEELLNKAIAEHPERDDYRMKLLETHFASKNSDAFATLAEDVHQRKGGDRQYWDRIQVMGRELCPSHALFSSDSAATLPGLDSDDLLPKKPETTDLELDADADELSADLDLGLDDADLGSANNDTQMLDQPLDLDAAAAEAGDELELPEEDLGGDDMMGGMASPDELDLAADLENISNEIAAEEQPAEPVAEATSGDDEGLEFDLGDFEAELEQNAEVSTESGDDELDLDDDFSLDFEASDLGFETDDEEAGSTGETTTAETDMELDADLDLGVALDDDSDSSSDLDLDMGGDLDLDEDAAGLDLDMGDDLDLGSSDDEPAMDMDRVSDADMASLDDDDFDISELSEDVDEVTTKLDLARAYIDMGDNEGARSILEEVKQEGNEQQQAQASELLQQAS